MCVFILTLFSKFWHLRVFQSIGEFLPTKQKQYLSWSCSERTVFKRRISEMVCIDQFVVIIVIYMNILLPGICLRVLVFQTTWLAKNYTTTGGTMTLIEIYNTCIVYLKSSDERISLKLQSVCGNDARALINFCRF